jgi:hypothetical protein
MPAAIVISSSGAKMKVPGLNLLVARMALGSYRLAPSYHPSSLLTNERLTRPRFQIFVLHFSPGRAKNEAQKSESAAA